MPKDNFMSYSDAQSVFQTVRSELASRVKTDDSRLSDARNAKDVYSWAKASSKPSYTASEVGAIATTVKGAANGVAELGSDGKVPSSQLPSYVDDVLEYANLASFPSTGESGKIYIAKDTNKTYRWSGSAYVEISASLALGETSSTAYRGDRGKTAYDHATESGKVGATASGLYKVASTAQGHIASLTAVQKSDITGLGIPAQDTTYSNATQSAAGLMSSTDKTKLDGVATGATANTGTVTSIIAGTGLTGGTITGSGTLAVSYGTSAGTACQGNDSRLSDARTPTAHNQASNTINAMTGYSKPSSTSAIAATDSLNTAIGKLEKALESGGSAMSKKRYTVSASSWSNSVDANGYYTYSLTLSSPTLKTTYAPNVYIAGADDNTFSTDTEKEQFALLDECNLTSSNTLVLYALTKPESTFYIFVEGEAN